MFSPQMWLQLLHRSDKAGCFDLLEGEPVRVERVAPTAGMWHVARCGSCERPSLWRAGVMIYPLRLGGTPPEDMPEAVRALFEEATAVARDVSACGGSDGARDGGTDDQSARSRCSGRGNPGGADPAD